MSVPAITPVRRQHSPLGFDVKPIAPAPEHDAGPAIFGAGVGLRAQQIRLDGRKRVARQRGQAEFGKPLAQDARTPGALEFAQCRGLQGGRFGSARLVQASSRLVAQQLGIFRQKRGAAGEGGVGMRPALPKRRQHAMPEEIAIHVFIEVGRILDPLQRVRLCVPQQFRAAHVQQRPQQRASAERSARPHRSEAIAAGRAQQPQQHRFGLVVLVVGQHQQLAIAKVALEGVVARLSSRRLQSLSAVARHLHTFHDQRDAEPLAKSNAMPFPVVGIGVQAMVDVDGAQDAGRADGLVASACSNAVESRPPLKPTRTCAPASLCNACSSVVLSTAVAA